MVLLYFFSEEDDPDEKYRLISIFAYFIVLVIIGLPVWWFTTRVYRAPLPLGEMYDVEVPSKTVRENSIPLSLEYDILITMINPDPKQLKVNLDGQLLDLNLQPFLTSIGAIANFTVKSQWLYLVDLGVTLKNYGNHFGLLEEQLPHIITPLEKKIWSHMSPRPTINLIVYTSTCEMPLHIYDSKRIIVKDNSFLSPRWGGIQILNVDKDSCEKGTFTPDIKPIVSIFLNQLERLLGLKGISDPDILYMKQVKVKEMVDSCRRTLKSLAQLLSEINSIVISDEVASKINKAMEFANKAHMYMEENRIDEALYCAKIAFENSEAAFSDPSLLALLYFPDDQKYFLIYH